MLLQLESDESMKARFCKLINNASGAELDVLAESFGACRGFSEGPKETPVEPERDRCDLDALQTLLEGTSPGPWMRCNALPEAGCSCGLVWSMVRDTTVADVNISMHLDGPGTLPREERHKNGLFIAVARQAVPALMTELREEREAKERLRARLFEANQWAASLGVVRVF